MKVHITEKMRQVIERSYNEQLSHFMRLGHTSKKILMVNEPDARERLHWIYREMGEILMGMEDIIPYLKEQNPKMASLIDMLLLFVRDINK